MTSPTATSEDSRDPSYRDGLSLRANKAPGFCDQILQTTSPFLIKPVRDLDVLDIGSGLGHISMELARRCRTVHGIEPSAALFEKAMALLASSGLANLTFRRAGV